MTQFTPIHAPYPLGVRARSSALWVSRFADDIDMSFPEDEPVSRPTVPDVIPRWIGLLVVSLAFTIYVCGYAWSTSVPDTARDVYQAYRIRHGLALPLEGPVLGIPPALHLRPIW